MFVARFLRLALALQSVLQYSLRSAGRDPGFTPGFGIAMAGERSSRELGGLEGWAVAAAEEELSRRRASAVFEGHHSLFHGKFRYRCFNWFQVAVSAATLGILVYTVSRSRMQWALMLSRLVTGRKSKGLLL